MEKVKKARKEILQELPEEDLLPKKPKKSIKPITEKEWEMNRGWYDSEQCAINLLEFYTDENGKPVNNYFNPKLAEYVRNKNHGSTSIGPDTRGILHAAPESIINTRRPWFLFRGAKKIYRKIFNRS